MLSWKRRWWLVCPNRLRHGTVVSGETSFWFPAPFPRGGESNGRWRRVVSRSLRSFHVFLILSFRRVFFFFLWFGVVCLVVGFFYVWSFLLDLGLCCCQCCMGFAQGFSLLIKISDGKKKKKNRSYKWIEESCNKIRFALQKLS